jgi:hypothetical protein
MSVGRKSAHERSLEELIEMKLDKVKIDEDLSYSDLVIEFSFQYDILFGEIKALVRSKSTNDILGVDIVDIVFPPTTRGSPANMNLFGFTPYASNSKSQTSKWLYSNLMSISFTAILWRTTKW